MKLYKFLILLIIIELALQIISLGLFCFNTFRYNNEKMISRSWYSKLPENSWWPKESAAAQAHPTFDIFLGWINAPFNSSHINIDGQGNRITPTNPTGKENKYLIYMFGGSALFGYNAEDKETIPSLLSLALNKQNIPSYIHNFGQIGFTSFQDTLYLQKILKNNVIPNTVIFYNGCNDLFVSATSLKPQRVYNEDLIQKAIQSLPKNEPVANKSFFSHNSFHALTSYLFTYIKIFSYPGNLIQTYIQHNSSKNTDTHMLYSAETIQEISNTIANDYIHNALTIEGLSKEYGFSYLLLWQPLIFSKSLTSDEHTILHEHIDDLRKIYTQTTHIIKEKKLNNFYDFNGVFQTIKNESIFTDTCHITPKGNSIVANEIENILIQNIFNRSTSKY